MSAFAAAVQRLRRDLPAALGRTVTTDDVIAVAVSGGPDSMALLALAAAAWPGQVIAATVDHGLRAAGADEAAMVADYCAISPPADTGAQLRNARDAPQWPIAAVPTGPRPAPGDGVAHTTLRPDTPLGVTSVQATARAARYTLLADWAVTHHATMLLTAHHADDQAETFLMRAARGSGLAGLTGIRSRRALTDTIPLVRPLLDWRRDELRKIVTANSIPFVDDPSNADDHYDRTRFRRLLANNDWLDPRHLAETAAYAREGHEALDAMIGWLWGERRAVPGNPEDREYQTWLDLTGLPRELKRRLTRKAITSVRNVNDITRPAFSDASNIEPLLDALDAGKAATHAGILVSRAGDMWRFCKAPPRRDTPTPHS